MPRWFEILCGVVASIDQYQPVCSIMIVISIVVSVTWLVVWMNICKPEFSVLIINSIWMVSLQTCINRHFYSDWHRDDIIHGPIWKKNVFLFALSSSRWHSSAHNVTSSPSSARAPSSVTADGDNSIFTLLGALGNPVVTTFCIT